MEEIEAQAEAIIIGWILLGAQAKWIILKEEDVMDHSFHQNKAQDKVPF